MQILKQLIDGQGCCNGIARLHRHTQKCGVVFVTFLKPVKFPIKINCTAVFKPWKAMWKRGQDVFVPPFPTPVLLPTFLLVRDLITELNMTVMLNILKIQKKKSAE